MLAHSMAASLKGNVYVNCISLGWIDTINSEFSEVDKKQYLVDRVGKPKDIAKAVTFLFR